MKKGAIIVVLMAVMIYAVYAFGTGETEEKTVYTGFVESDITKAMTLTGGRLVKLYVREGDAVVKGQLVAEMDKAELEFSRAKLEAAVEMKKSKLDSLLEGADDKDLEGAKLQMEGLLIKLNLAADNLNLKQKKLEDIKSLVESNALESDQLDTANLAFQQAESDYKVLQTEYSKAKVAYEDLIEGADNHTLSIAQEDLKMAQHDLEAVDWKLEQTIIRAPSDGIVRNVYYSEEELVPQGYQILDMIEADSLYVQFYVDEANFSKVVLGDPVTITVDGSGETFDVIVSEISNYAQFTPKNVSTKEDRQSLVFKIKASVGDSMTLHSGMMVDVMLNEGATK